MQQNLAVFAGVLTALCVVPYLRDIVRGTTRPQRASWFVFAALSVVAAASQFADGAIAGAWLSMGAAAGFSAVFVVSLWRGEGGGSVADLGALAIGMVGVVVWIVARNPVVAVGAVIVAELVAVSITTRKATRDPASETLVTWAVDCGSGAVAIAATRDPSVVTLMYPVNHLCANGWVVIAILRGRARQGDQRRPTVSVRQKASGYTSAPVIDGL